MRDLFIGCLIFTLLATAGVAVATPDRTDRVVLAACLLAQVGFLAAYVTGTIAHMVFVIAIMYGSMLGGRAVLIMAALMTLLTLCLRAALGGCLFSVVEEDTESVVPRGSWVADAQLAGFLAIGVVRVWRRWDEPPALLRWLGLSVIFPFVACTWNFGGGSQGSQRRCDSQGSQCRCGIQCRCGSQGSQCRCGIQCRCGSQGIQCRCGRQGSRSRQSAQSRARPPSKESIVDACGACRNLE